MTRILRVLFVLALLFFARLLLQRLFAAFRQAGSGLEPDTQRPQAPAGGELKKDPVCGTYVAALGAPTVTVNGEVFYFCSPECREKYALTSKR